MTLQHFLIITVFQTAMLGLVALVSLVHRRKRHPTTQLLGYLYLAGFSIQIFGFTIQYFNFTPIPNGTLRNLAGSSYDFFLMILGSLFYYESFNKRYKIPIVGSVIVYCIFAVSNLIFFQQTSTASYNHLFASVIIICFALIYFYKLLVELPEKNIYRSPMFWFNTAFLFFHSTTFFIYAFMDYLVKVLNDNLIVYYSIHNIFSIIESVLLLIGLHYDWKTISPSATRW